jgi:O-glycosyl hydrolase
VQAWQLTAANAIVRLPHVAVTGSSFVVTLPPQSVTLFVVGSASGAPGAPTNFRIRAGD